MRSPLEALGEQEEPPRIHAGEVSVSMVEQERRRFFVFGEQASQVG